MLDEKKEDLMKLIALFTTLAMSLFLGCSSDSSNSSGQSADFWANVAPPLYPAASEGQIAEQEATGGGYYVRYTSTDKDAFDSYLDARKDDGWDVQEMSLEGNSSVSHSEYHMENTVNDVDYTLSIILHVDYEDSTKSYSSLRISEI